MNRDGYATDNFKWSEFECHCGCGCADMTSETLRALQAARGIYGNPIHVSSGFRCVPYDLSRGGKGNHPTGQAVDVLCSDMQDRYDLIYAAMRAGFRRVEVAPNYLHFDVVKERPGGLWLHPGLKWKGGGGK